MLKIHTFFRPQAMEVHKLPGLLIFFTAIILFQLNCQGQDKTVIQGTIHEIGSEMPLSGAHILIQGTSYGTISGPDGSFRLIISEFPVVLKVSHIGFEERLFTITEDVKDDNLMLGIRFSAELLEAVTITDQKVELIFKNASYSVLDFEFHENGLMLLIYRNRLKGAELVLLSTMNDTLATLPDLPGTANSLHRDCRDFIHYVAQDTAYQIHFTGDKLRLTHPLHIRFFQPVADAFVAYHNDYYYYSINSMQKQVIEYVRYDSAINKYSSFRRVADQKMLRILRDNPMHHYLLDNLTGGDMDFNLMLMGANASFEGQREALSLSREASREAHYLRACVYTPVYAPLFKSEDNIIIFNHPESQIEFLNTDGFPLNNTPIDYHHKKNWAELILKDEIREKYYTVYINSNRATIQSIDIFTGLSGQLNILHYPFVKKILVKNGYAYFTYRQPGSVERTMLFRQKLKVEDSEYARSE